MSEVPAMPAAEVKGTFGPEVRLVSLMKKCPLLELRAHLLLTCVLVVVVSHDVPVGQVLTPSPLNARRPRRARYPT